MRLIVNALRVSLCRVLLTTWRLFYLNLTSFACCASFFSASFLQVLPHLPCCGYSSGLLTLLMLVITTIKSHSAHTSSLDGYAWLLIVRGSHVSLLICPRRRLSCFETLQVALCTGGLPFFFICKGLERRCTNVGRVYAPGTSVLTL